MKKPKYKRGEGYDIHNQTQPEMKSWERKKQKTTKRDKRFLK
jgi:hypothetical protein